MTKAMEAVAEERRQQDRRWGADHDPGNEVMLAVLMEEVGEVARAMNEDWPREVDWSCVRAELVQAAAVAVRWVEQLDRRDDECRS